MKFILVSYNNDCSWVKNWTDDYLIYDRGEDKSGLDGIPESKVIHTQNQGQVDYDKLGYLVENYDNLPEAFVWGKANLFKYTTELELTKAIENNNFAPLLRFDHKTYSDKYGEVCFYEKGIYWERNDSWYVTELDTRHFKSFSEFAAARYMKNPPFIPFPPGGNFLLTRERVHRYNRDFYQEMRDVLPYSSNPAEAHMCERAYYLLWQ